MRMTNHFIETPVKQFKYYKLLGEQTFEQLTEEQLFYQPNETGNSIAIIVQHLWGNMLSRWTDFLTTDGEKDWRKRDEEFEPPLKDKLVLLQKWNEGWDCLFAAIQALRTDDLEKEIFIRNQGHTVMQAIVRQLAHYSYHVGQIVFIGKMLTGENWRTLSIAKGNSVQYNTEKFSKEKTKEHFTQEYLKRNDMVNNKMNNA